MMKYISFILCLLFIYSCKKEDTARIKKAISTKSGVIVGSYNAEKKVYAFKGIPYAQPPVGDLRWEPPQPIKGWHDTLDATTFGSIAMQAPPHPFMMWTQEFISPAGDMSEDCLTLNIWTKKGKRAAKRPVIVFIHGGGFTGGSGSVPIYDGTNMAAKGVVFVTINYRLGIFGFLALPVLTKASKNHSSGNYGLLDQIEALKWVNKNIAAFGGDPENITIAGQSAGAMSVHCLVASPLAKGLFERAIAESDAAFDRLSKLSIVAEKEEQKVLSILPVKDLSKMRAIPADSLLKVQMKTGAFGPVIDGYVIPQSIRKIFEEGSYNNVPVLTGWNAEDGSFLINNGSLADFREMIKKKYGPEAKILFRLFPSENDSVTRKSKMRWHTLQHFELQSWEWMKLQNKTGGAKVYLYYFNRSLPYTKEEEDYGAFHTGEIPYAYANQDESNRPWTAEDKYLEKIMSSFWINFARYGNPNQKELPYWPPCNEKNRYQVMFLGDTIGYQMAPFKNTLQYLYRLKEGY